MSRMDSFVVDVTLKYSVVPANVIFEYKSVPILSSPDLIEPLELCKVAKLKVSCLTN